MGSAVLGAKVTPATAVVEMAFGVATLTAVAVAAATVRRAGVRVVAVAVPSAVPSGTMRCITTGDILEAPTASPLEAKAM
jgi:hypothetical protein